jgi:hypothetical protein
VPQEREEKRYEPHQCQRRHREERYSRRSGFTISLVFIIYLGEAVPTDIMVIEMIPINFTLK